MLNLLFFIVALAMSCGPDGKDYEQTRLDLLQCFSKDSKSDAKVCKVISKFLKDTPHYSDKENIYLEEEWKIRNELKQMGFELSDSVIPTYYVFKKTSKGDFLFITDWSYELLSTAHIDSQVSWLMYKAGICNEVFDSGDFQKFHIFIRNKKSKTFKLNFSDSQILGTHIASVENFFKNPETTECLKDSQGKTVSCLTQYWSKDFPEVSIFDDQRGSTGVVVNTYMYLNGEYQKVMSRDGHYESLNSGGKKHMAFFQHTTGEGFNEGWSFAYPGQVHLWNSKRNYFEVSNDLTKKYFPVTEKKIQEGTEEPQLEGFYIPTEGKGLYHFVN
jgi:hypothetical protein